tara:strand:- start:225 stop:617 length:393 start_codon:yes stop_codon:yes gene_type:complete
MKLDLNIILRDCCAYYEQDIEDVRSKSRIRELIEVRQMYCYIAKFKHKHKLVPIAELINRNHASVLHSAKAIDIQLSINNIEVREDYIAIIDSMEGDNIKMSIAMANQRIEKRKRENQKDKDLIKKLSTY